MMLFFSGAIMPLVSDKTLSDTVFALWPTLPIYLLLELGNCWSFKETSLR